MGTDVFISVVTRRDFTTTSGRVTSGTVYNTDVREDCKRQNISSE